MAAALPLAGVEPRLALAAYGAGVWLWSVLAWLRGSKVGQLPEAHRTAVMG